MRTLLYYFSTSAASRPNLFLMTGIVVMISGIAFDRPDRLSRLRAFPCDRFKIYTIIPIIRIELKSIQAIEVVSVVRVVCDRPGSVSIWSFRGSEQYLRWLGRSGRSSRSMETSLGGQLPWGAAAEAVRVYEIDYIFAFSVSPLTFCLNLVFLIIYQRQIAFCHLNLYQFQCFFVSFFVHTRPITLQNVGTSFWEMYFPFKPFKSFYVFKENTKWRWLVG